MKILFAALLVAAVVVSGCTSGPSANYASFATCVKDAGIVEYGAYWCPNCARVKLALGDAWSNLNYLECDARCARDARGNLPDYCKGFEGHSDQCLALGIDRYPSWVRGNEILYVGTDLAQVAAVSSCQLPS